MTDSRRVMQYDRWEQQWLRGLRWYTRALDAAGRGEPGKASRDADDYADALCISVWHLKDWLKHDPRQTVLTSKQIERFANTQPALQVVADIANGYKHVILTTGKGDRTGTVRQGLLSWSGTGDPDDPASVERVEVFVEVAEGEEPREAVDIAYDGLLAWSDWLTEAGLDLPAELPVPPRGGGRLTRRDGGPRKN